MTKAYVFDLDGTLANLDHRLHLIKCETPDWDGFFAAVSDDGVYDHIAGVARALATKHAVVLVSGRSDQCRHATERWLAKNNIPYIFLYMRTAGDHRPDYKVKRDLLTALLEDGYEPIMALDDRDQAVEMWRDAGVPCAQVAVGNF